MSRELLIGAGPGEWRAAWLEDGVAAELHVERGDVSPAGSIHLGRVVRLVAGLDAALVDIGEERPGFLPLRGTPPDEGARLIVRVRREARRGKGASLSTRLPDESFSEISEQGARLGPPAQLHPRPGFAQRLALRLPAAPERVMVDATGPVAELRTAFPQAETVHQPADQWPFDLDALFEAALAPSVALAGGGAMHIEETRAAVLIDIDTGSPETGTAEQTALATNLAAAQAMARQLRLRSLGGGIVVDFAALDSRGLRERVREAVAVALAADPAKPQLLGWTRIGHLEIVRPRRGRSLGEAMLEPSRQRKNAITLAFEALRMLAREARTRPAAQWRLVAGPAIAAALHGTAAAGLQSLEARLGRKIAVEIVQRNEADLFDIRAG